MFANILHYLMVSLVQSISEAPAYLIEALPWLARFVCMFLKPHKLNLNSVYNSTISMNLISVTGAFPA